MKKLTEEEIEKIAEEITEEIVEEIIIRGYLDNAEGVKRLKADLEREVREIERKKKIKIN